MVQTNLKSDNFCGYNTSAAPFYWVLDPVQNYLQYNVGEVGVPTGVGLHTPGEVIKVDSYLKDIGNYLTSCVPPVPPQPSKLGNASDASIEKTGPALPTQGFTSGQDNQPLMDAQFPRKGRESFTNVVPKINTGVAKANGEYSPEMVDRSTFLLPDAGQNVKRSAADYSSVNWQAGFGGNGGNLHTDPQNLTYVIERMWLERGGLDSNQLIKNSYNLYTKEHPHGPRNLKGQFQKPTCEKVRQPYPIHAPFGLDFKQTSEHFNSLDVASQGISTPVLDQNNNIPFNYNAVYSNGGCNNLSLIKDKKMCSNNSNDLTGINEYSFTRNISPPGI